ncbi:MAG: NADH-quinone oxidoreductase subunit L [Nitrospira sp.]|nr:NADH-quinone oxidoreductase subunit L [Nitrospira sp.]MDH4368249.1 NADH-quinone oxidoreductase subunit L [Nitrospira sp.]MDH5348381.1 NADH-quinone oxidoreductase subunit L [Nitrospira sp.]MDH5495843.1 NADH-quinone oxidoreductase subunit L [Nitrospira sp.]MDH5725962.1 NADH-quinone oxidoreductase subunit L [Nitrospira sp.]
MLYALIPLLPLAAFLVLGLGGSRIKDRAHLVAVPAVLLSLTLALTAFFEVASGSVISVPLYTWLTSGDLDIHIGLHIDRLTAVMLLLVTGVSSLVHIYTIGYMHGDSGYARFFSYIALFTFSMLMLVLADNLLQLFIFWEAVGLCSYLLIGHWYERASACAAATKAFLVNRVGDFGFMLGLLLVWYHFGSLNYLDIFPAIHEATDLTMNLLGPFGGVWDVSVFTLIALLLFTGAVGKSAQVPLHVWLPDAMEGPTPISALIHAATMVTAGVFMVARLAPIYNLSPTAMSVVAVTGAVTMLLGATIALTQTDIKRVVAYSTVSQLGYMIMACGLGAYASGMYHLLTHGAFKALLFLGCGSVIIALHHEQDMRHMGGLKDKLPITYWTFVVGSLALAGFPLTAGFFSKDDILVSAWSSGTLGQVLSILGLLTALLTAFYSFRLVFATFWGPSHVEPHHATHIQEPSRTMTTPLLILAVFSVLTGYLGIPSFLEPVFSTGQDTATQHGSDALMIMLAATAMGLLGIASAYYVYVLNPDLPERLATRWKVLYQASLNKWYVDELYDYLFVRPTLKTASELWKRVDVEVIDGAVNGIARAIAWGGWLLRLIQSGQTQHYALAMALGIVVLTAYLLL